jgi:hypothetical protein
MSKRYKMRFRPYDHNYQAYTRWQSLCTKDSYQIIESKSLSGLLPEALLNKSSSVLLMEKETSGSSIFVANINRIDINTSGSQIDQQPYIVAFNHSGSKCFGGFIEHGNWTNRTTTFIDPKLWEIVSGSGVLEYLPIAQLPEKHAGSISELKVVSQNEAFITALKSLLHQ